MTLGEKIKVTRIGFGLTQEQMAEKLSVTRQAITKWETDKGVPDIENLRNIAQLLNVSVDYLIDEEKVIDKIILREKIDLSEIKKGRKKVKKDKIIQNKFPSAQIHTLLAEQKLNKREKIVDNVFGWLTPMPFMLPQFMKGVNNLDKEFYLVKQNDKQFLVVITDEFIESRQLCEIVKEKKFELEGWKFTDCGPILHVDK